VFIEREEEWVPSSLIDGTCSSPETGALAWDGGAGAAGCCIVCGVRACVRRYGYDGDAGWTPIKTLFTTMSFAEARPVQRTCFLVVDGRWYTVGDIDKWHLAGRYLGRQSFVCRRSGDDAGRKESPGLTGRRANELAERVMQHAMRFGSARSWESGGSCVPIAVRMLLLSGRQRGSRLGAGGRRTDWTGEGE
jgi:hypothetical protein